MKKPIAMGKIAADGTILKATPGIVVTTDIVAGTLTSDDIGYKVELPDRLVCDGNYIVLLTAETYEEDQDFVYTTIGTRYQNSSSFEVIIWANRSQTVGGVQTVRTPWHFVIFDI